MYRQGSRGISNGALLRRPGAPGFLGPGGDILLPVHTTDRPTLGKLLCKCSTTIFFFFSRQEHSYSANVEHNISFPLGDSRIYIYFSATVVTQWLFVKRCLITALVTFRSIRSPNETIPLDLRVVTSPADMTDCRNVKVLSEMSHSALIFLRTHCNFA